MAIKEIVINPDAIVDIENPERFPEIVSQVSQCLSILRVPAFNSLAGREQPFGVQRPVYLRSATT